MGPSGVFGASFFSARPPLPGSHRNAQRVDLGPSQAESAALLDGARTRRGRFATRAQCQRKAQSKSQISLSVILPRSFIFRDTYV